MAVVPFVPVAPFKAVAAFDPASFPGVFARDSGDGRSAVSMAARLGSDPG
jgi:hypothetical protein